MLACVAFWRNGRCACPTGREKPDTRQRGGLCGSRRSSGVATHREATALKRKRRRARRGLWPSDGAAHCVPLVELRPVDLVFPVFVVVHLVAFGFSRASTTATQRDTYCRMFPGIATAYLITFSQGKTRGSESEKPGGEPPGAGQTQRPRRSVPPGPVRLTSSRPDRSRLGFLSRPPSPVHRANVHCEQPLVAHSPIEQHCKGGGL